MSTKAHHFIFNFVCGDCSPMVVIVILYSCIRFNSCWFMNVNKSSSFFFNIVVGDNSPMVDAAHSCWFDPDVKKLGVSGINPQSTRNQILNLITLLWGLFPSGCHCLFVLLYKVQFLWVHECCGDCSPMVVIVYFILLYKIQFFLVHECQQKLIIIFFSNLLLGLFPNGGHCLFFTLV